MQKRLEIQWAQEQKVYSNPHILNLIIFILGFPVSGKGLLKSDEKGIKMVSTMYKISKIMESCLID